ncbi:isochorismatase family protein [uncultured Sunxiuqinia sp.]|uniref:isochorismatase family protein n=1 Tax=uncultured Sunxiuqinia sp. TaxID=1573825 RepID=UPI002AA60150|nr:isochorismatase family protein [uncultured Sunxiuqinia sp.]
MRITRENTVGLIVDIQERLVPAMAEKQTFLNNTKILIEGLQTLSLNLLATQQYTKGLGDTIPEISSLIKDFRPIEKRDFSCCDEAVVADELKMNGAHNVIVCGIESHVCVMQTAIDLKESGYNPIVVMDCVSSRTLKNVELAADRFRFEGIMMTSYESILFELTRSAAASEFKSISKLVK